MFLAPISQMLAAKDKKKIHYEVTVQFNLYIQLLINITYTCIYVLTAHTDYTHTHTQSYIHKK